MNKKLFTCICNDCSHNVILAFQPDLDPDNDYLYIYVHLNTHLTFLERLTKAIKYIFKLESDEWGHYSEVILDKPSAMELVDFIKSIDE